MCSLFFLLPTTYPCRSMHLICAYKSDTKCFDDQKTRDEIVTESGRSQQSKIHFIDINKHNSALDWPDFVFAFVWIWVFLMIFPFFSPPIVFTRWHGAECILLKWFGHYGSVLTLIENYAKDNGSLHWDPNENLNKNTYACYYYYTIMYLSALKCQNRQKLVPVSGDMLIFGFNVWCLFNWEKGNIWIVFKCPIWNFLAITVRYLRG